MKNYTHAEIKQRGELKKKLKLKGYSAAFLFDKKTEELKEMLKAIK